MNGVFCTLKVELHIGHMHRYRIPMGLRERYYEEDLKKKFWQTKRLEQQQGSIISNMFLFFLLWIWWNSMSLLYESMNTCIHLWTCMYVQFIFIYAHIFLDMHIYKIRTFVYIHILWLTSFWLMFTFFGLWILSETEPWIYCLCTVRFWLVNSKELPSYVIGKPIILHLFCFTKISLLLHGWWIQSIRIFLGIVCLRIGFVHNLVMLA